MFSVEYAGADWHYVLPRPFACMYLAGMGARDEDARAQALLGYLEHVLLPDSLDQAMSMAMDPDDLFDTAQLAQLIEEVQAAHSARPFFTDVNLAATAVAQWPQVRGRLVMAGVADPLRQLPTVYALLDATEAMILDGMGKEEEREAYWRRMYTPPAGSLSSQKRTPRGFSREEELAAFEEWEQGV